MFGRRWNAASSAMRGRSTHRPLLVSMAVVVALQLQLGVQLCCGRKAGLCPLGSDNRDGGPCREAGKPWQRDGVCIELKGSRVVGECILPDSRTFRLRVVAKLLRLKTNIPSAKPVEDLWVRGSGPGLSWERAVKMKRQSDPADEWQLELEYKSDSDALSCRSPTHCSHSQRALEFRLYRDELGQDEMLGPNFFFTLPISDSMNDGGTPTVTVHPWFDGETITEKPWQVLKSSMDVTGIKGELEVRYGVLFPPSFDHNVHKTYPLVVTFGSYTGESRQSIHLLEHMFVHEASIEEAIVVFIYYATDISPFCRYSVYGGKFWRCKPGQACHDCFTCWDPERGDPCDKDQFVSQAEQCLQEEDCGDRNMGDMFLDLVELDLLPALRRMTANRILTDFPRHRITIIGYQGPGLLACHAAITRPSIYGNAGCISAPFYWPLTSLQSSGEPGYKDTFWAVNYRITMHPELRMLYLTQKYYIDVGEQDSMYLPIVDIYLHTEGFIEQLKKVLGLTVNDNIVYASVPNTWTSYYHFTLKKEKPLLHRLRLPLTFFLGAKGGSTREHSRLMHLSEEFFAKRKAELSLGEEEGSSMQTGGAWVTHINDSSLFCNADGRSKQTDDVPLPIFLGTIGGCVLVSVIVTVAIMCLRESSKREEAEDKREEEELLGDLSSSDDL